jgi:hypothetical protein
MTDKYVPTQSQAALLRRFGRECKLKAEVPCTEEIVALVLEYFRRKRAVEIAEARVREAKEKALVAIVALAPEAVTEKRRITTPK